MEPYFLLRYIIGEIVALKVYNTVTLQATHNSLLVVGKIHQSLIVFELTPKSSSPRLKNPH